MSSKWTIYLNVRSEIIKIMKLIEENIGASLGLGSTILNMTPKVQMTKEKKLINWTYSKLL